jgi:hypothetical protein
LIRAEQGKERYTTPPPPRPSPSSSARLHAHHPSHFSRRRRRRSCLHRGRGRQAEQDGYRETRRIQRDKTDTESGQDGRPPPHPRPSTARRSCTGECTTPPVTDAILTTPRHEARRLVTAHVCRGLVITAVQAETSRRLQVLHSSCARPSVGIGLTPLT